MGLPYSPSAKYSAEFIGTFFLVFTIGCNVHTGSLAAALSIGSMLMVMIYALGSVSGAHFNPAVTLSVALSGRNLINFADMVLYMVAQVLGGITGALTYYLLLGEAFILMPVAPHYGGGAVAVEILYTAALCYVVLNVATTHSEQVENGQEHGNCPNGFFGLAIGFTVVASAITIGPISGCSLNPAVSIGSMSAAFVLHGKGTFLFWTTYVFAPFAGAVVGAMAFFCVQGGVYNRYEYWYLSWDLNNPKHKDVKKLLDRETGAGRSRDVKLSSLKSQKSIPLTTNDVLEFDKAQLQTQMFCGLLWELSTDKQGTVDLMNADIACVKYNKNGRHLNAVYFAEEHRNDKDNKISLTEDNADLSKVKGQKEDDQRIYFKLADVQNHVYALAFCVNIFTKDHKFKDVKKLSVRLFDSQRNTEICCFDKGDLDENNNFLIVAVLHRHGDTWRMVPVDEGAYKNERVWRHFESDIQACVMKEAFPNY